MTKQSVLNSVEEVLEDIRQGKVVIVVDDEDRENEGDFIVAAEKITPEIVNFMLHNGRGVMCAPLTEDRCKELELDMQVADNTSLLGTPFTVSIDLLGEGCTTGVSAHDRAATIRALVDPKTKPSDLGRPGHIFPLRARNRGVLRRPGHTEAVVDLTRMAGLQTGGALIEIMNEDGTMARMPDLLEIAKKFDLKIISIADIIAYRLRNESIVERGETVDMPTQWGHFRLIPFRQKSNGLEHVAMIKGEWKEGEPILVRVNEKLQRKYADVRRDEVRFEAIRCEDADYVLVAYGSSARICSKVVEMGREEGIKVGLLRPITLFPFPTEAIGELSRKVKGFLSVEMSAGQMVEDVRLAVEGRAPVCHYGRMGGIVHSPGEVFEALKSNFLSKTK